MQKSTPNRPPHRAPPRLPGGVGRVCPNCQKALRAEAMFCTRCGTNVAQSAPAAFAPLPQAFAPLPQAMPRPAVRKTAVATPVRAATPKRKRSVFAILFLIMLLGVGLWVLFNGIDTYRTFPPSPFPPRPFATTATPEDSHLPAAPDADMPLPVRTGAEAAAIQMAWTETGVVDSSGAVGLRVHARVRTPVSTPVHLVAHFYSFAAGAVKSDDPRYRDPLGQAAVASETLPGNSVIETTAFIPWTALKLSGSDQHLKLLPALFDENNQPIATGLHVPFYCDRGNVYISAVHVDALNTGGHRLSYTLQAVEHSRQIFGEAIVQFKDDKGAMLPGRPLFSNAGGELMTKAAFYIPAGYGVYKMDATPILLQPGFVPPGASAEMRLFDPGTGQWLTPPLEVAFP